MSDVKKVLTSVDRSTKAINAAAEGLSKVTATVAAEVEVLAKQQAQLATDIEFKQNELDNLDSKLTTAVREQAAELALRVRENEREVLDSLLKKTGQVATTQAALNQLEEDKAVAEDRAAQKEFAAVKEAEAKLHADYRSRISTIESNHKVEIAQLNANATADKETIATLKEQVAQLRDDLKAEREARVQMAEAAAKAQGVIVNTGK